MILELAVVAEDGITHDHITALIKKANRHGLHNREIVDVLYQTGGDVDYVYFRHGKTVEPKVEL